MKILTTLSVLVLAANCGDSGGPPDKLSGAFMDTFRRWCDKTFACADEYVPAAHSGRSLEEFAGGPDAGACFAAIERTFLLAEGKAYLDALDASVSAGRIRYAPDDYQTCSDLFMRQSCDQILEQNGQSYTEPEVCRTVKVGLVSPGDACTLNDDCAARFCEDDVCATAFPAAR